MLIILIKHVASQLIAHGYTGMYRYQYDTRQTIHKTAHTYTDVASLVAV